MAYKQKKGSPMARNFGIGSPAKQKKTEAQMAAERKAGNIRRKKKASNSKYQKAANDYYLKTGFVSGPGTENDKQDATSDALYEKMHQQYYK